MDSIFTDLDRVRGTTRRVALATLVATRGTAPKKEGARMWVDEHGRIVGAVTIGGCVDAQVVEEAERVLATSSPKLLSVALGDEEAFDLGLTCAGTVDVLVQPLDLDRPDDPALALLEWIRAEADAGRSAVAVTRLDGAGPNLVVFEDGSVAGTLGEEALDAEARARALELMRTGAARTMALGDGAVEAFFEVHGPPPLLAVFGAGQLAQPLVAFGKELGMRVVVVDGRPRYATRERFPQADEVLVGIPSEIAASLRYGTSSIVVLVAHDYKYDIPVLRAVLEHDPAYIGMLGSRKRGRAILEFLAEAGIEPAALERIHVPSGLDIGAQSAAEIAFSILAEALAVRAGRRGGPLRERAGGARQGAEPVPAGGASPGAP